MRRIALAFAKPKVMQRLKGTPLSALKWEHVKAALEIASGVAGCVPIAGTAVSAVIDIGLAFSDWWGW